MTSRSHKKIASAGTSKSGKAVNLARPVRATRRSDPETSEPKSFTSGYTDIRELLLSLATEELAGAPVIIEDEDEEEEDAELIVEDEVDQASTKAVSDANNDPDDYQKSLKTFGDGMAATSAGRTADWVESVDPPHSSLKRKATRSPSPARSAHRLHFDTGSPLFVPEDGVIPMGTPAYSDQTHTPATAAADDNHLEPSPSPSPHPRDEAVTAGKEATKAHKDTRAHNETIEVRNVEQKIAAEAENTRKETETAREAPEKSNAKLTPDQTAMLNIALFVNTINATHSTHPGNTATNPPRFGNAAEKFSAVANQMLNRQRTFVESFETWERETYDPGAYDTASTRALRTFIHGLRGGVDEMQGYADDFDTL